MTNGNGNGNGGLRLRERVGEAGEKMRTSSLWESVFRPGSPLQAGLHRHPPQPLLRDHEQRALPPAPGEGEAARSPALIHAVLGGLSFFLFILLTITGIFLMFYTHLTATQAYADAQALSTSVAFGSLVRNMHRWGAT